MIGRLTNHRVAIRSGLAALLSMSGAMDIKKAAGSEWSITDELKNKKSNTSQNWEKIKNPEEAEKEKSLNWLELTNEQKNLPSTTHGITLEAIRPGNEITIDEPFLPGEHHKEREQRTSATAYARGSMIQIGKLFTQILE